MSDAPAVPEERLAALVEVFLAIGSTRRRLGRSMLRA
jgi:hypothetical protein